VNRTSIGLLQLYPSEQSRDPGAVRRPGKTFGVESCCVL
jgi:hypothetical protein